MTVEGAQKAGVRVVLGPPESVLESVGLDAVVFQLRLIGGTDDPASTWLVEGVGSLIQALRSWCSELATAEGRVAGLIVLVVGDGLTESEAELAEGMVEAVRGVTQSVTLEHRGSGLTLTCVVADERSLDDLAAVARYAASDPGVYAAGASLDLRGPR